MKRLVFTMSVLLLTLVSLTGANTYDNRNYLYFVAVNGNDTVYLQRVSSPNIVFLEYSTDKKNWTTYSFSSKYGPSIRLANAGDTVFFRAGGSTGKNSIFSGNGWYTFKFGVDDVISAGGNVMSLLDASCTQTSVPSNAFYCLFINAKQLISAPSLPATTLAYQCYCSMFQGCSSLGTAPSLPATTLADYCYMYMFRNCLSLTNAPQLPATTLGQGCYLDMFRGCSALTQAPQLSATVLADDCYSGMFSYCASLLQAPQLSSTTLAKDCYNGMFSYCTSLTQAPQLPATTLYANCYEEMFSGCTSLVHSPSLPATTLIYYCYHQMFSDCSSLVDIPQLNAPTMVEGCYYEMFKNCTKLNVDTLSADCEGTELHIPNISLANPPKYTFIRMFDGCHGLTVNKNSSYCVSEYIPYDTVDYLHFVARESNCSIRLDKRGTPNAINIEYSTNKKRWNTYTWNNNIGTTIVLQNEGDTLFFRAGGSSKMNAGFSTNHLNYYNFACPDSVSAMGNIMSLLDASCASVSVPDSAFMYLFQNCYGLLSAPELPATVLSDNCYQYMFSNCISLKQAPALPATNLAKACYSTMFSGCWSLTSAPELPATSLSPECYLWMFMGCNALTNAPELPATILAEDCYYGMFSDCISLTRAPYLPADSLARYCYNSMFSGCTALRKVQILPATKLAFACYLNMFKDCTSLKQAPALPATILPQSCYNSMFKGCSSLVAAPDLTATNLGPWCYSNMFDGCSRLVVDTMSDNCDGSMLLTPVISTSSWNYQMFAGCQGSYSNNIQSNSAYCVSTGSYDNVDYLHFVALTENCTVSLNRFGTPDTVSLEYSTDKIRWRDYNWSEANGESIFLANVGDTVFFRAYDINGTFSKGHTNYYVFAFGDNDVVEAHGNIMSLLDWTCTETSLPDYAFTGLFSNASQLVCPPLLPATELGEYCYSKMFMNCSSLKYAPELKATTLATRCYQQMFYNCQQLYVDTMSSNCNGAELMFPYAYSSISSYCSNMFYGCQGSYASNLQARGSYCIYRASDNKDYLKFIANNGNDSVRLDKTGNPYDISLKYSTDKETWFNYTWNGNTGKTITLLNVGDTVFFKASGTNGKNTSFSKSYVDYYSFVFGVDDSVSAEGNIMSLLDASCSQTTLPDYAFLYLFYNATQLKTAPLLPATTLSDDCYSAMFQGCTSLIQTPSLPATTLAYSCYNSMFLGCSSLKYVGDLPATTLTDWCYYDMFYGCESLIKAPRIYATSLAEGCCSQMFYGCTSLVNAPALSATTLGESCYSAMFENCSSLVQAPSLPATSLSYWCYANMFNGCTSLVEAPALPASTMVWSCYRGMFSGCSSLALIPTMNVVTLADNCFDEMFKDCVRLTVDTMTSVCVANQLNVPNATTEPSEWNNNMFSGCQGPYHNNIKLNSSYCINNTLTFNVAVEMVGNGQVEGLGTYGYGNTVHLNARSTQSHEFDHWGDGNTSPNISFVIKNDTTLDVVFSIRSFEVSANVNDANMGSVMGSSTYNYGQVATLVAIPNQHYHLERWSNGMTTTTITIPVYSDTTLTAIFAIDQHTVTVYSNDTTMGSISGCGTFDYGQTATLTATPNEHYHFVSWSNGKTNPIITVKVLGDSVLTATFAGNQHTVTVLSNDATMGSVTGGGSFVYGQNATLVATANEHYHFVSWSNGKTTPVIVVPVLGDSILFAYFAINRHTVTAISSDSVMGAVSGSGEYDYGQSATLTATANNHYHFVSWSNGKSASTIIVPVYGDSTLVATFAANQHTITAISGDPTKGSVVGGGSYSYGSQAILTAVAEDHYHFVSWSNGKTIPTIMVPVLGDSVLIAYFEIDQHLITAGSNDTTMGYVIGGGYLDYGQQAILTAIAYPNYHFVSWSNGKTTASITVPVYGDSTLLAYFATNLPDQHMVTVNVNDPAMGSVTGGGMYNHGAYATLTAIPNANHHFVNWSNGETSTVLSITVVSDTILTANFMPVSTDVEDVTEVEYIAYTRGKTIFVHGATDQPVYLYDMTGNLVASEQKASDEVSFDVYADGIYVVMIGNDEKAIRVVVK